MPVKAKKAVTTSIKRNECSAKEAEPSNVQGLSDADEINATLASFTPKQREKVLALLERANERISGPPMRLEFADETLQVIYKHADQDVANLKLMAELATCDPAFLAGITGQVAFVGGPGQRFDEVNSNFLLSVVRAVEPRDELETMLAVQMGAIHAATMTMARRFNRVETIPQQDAAERALNKLARTYAMQMEALKRYRTGGQQKVTVEHVTVNAGGQAIVGAVTQGGRDSTK